MESASNQNAAHGEEGAPIASPTPAPASASASAAAPSRVGVAVGWALVVLWAGFIFYMSSNTGSGLNDGDGIVSQIYRALHAAQTALFGPDVDVVSSCAHFCEYTVFGALWVNALRHHMPLRRAMVLGVACASLYGVTDEFHQLFVEGRMCDPADWAVDTAGALLELFWRALARGGRRAGRGTSAGGNVGPGRDVDPGRCTPPCTAAPTWSVTLASAGRPRPGARKARTGA